MSDDVVRILSIDGGGIRGIIPASRLFLGGLVAFDLLEADGNIGFVDVFQFGENVAFAAVFFFQFCQLGYDAVEFFVKIIDLTLVDSEEPRDNQVLGNEVACPTLVGLIDLAVSVLFGLDYPAQHGHRRPASIVRRLLSAPDQGKGRVDDREMGTDLEGEGEPGAGPTNENEVGKLRDFLPEYPTEYRSGEKTLGMPRIHRLARDGASVGANPQRPVRGAHGRLHAQLAVSAGIAE